MKNLIVICTMVLGIANMANADITTVYDHFNDDTLDPAWSVSFVNSTDWSYTESGTNLTVTDITPTVINNDYGYTWAQVILSQTFTPLTDFDVDFDFSWTSAGSNNPMQTVAIQLYDSAGGLIATAEYYDHWVLLRGAKYAAAGGNSIFPEHSTMPFDGTASVDISRIGDNVEVLWDGDSLVSRTSSSALSRVDLVFGYFAYYSATYGASFFDSESIDLVNIQGQVVPLPSALILGSIGLSFASWKLRRRKTV